MTDDQISSGLIKGPSLWPRNGVGTTLVKIVRLYTHVCRTILGSLLSERQYSKWPYILLDQAR